MLKTLFNIDVHNLNNVGEKYCNLLKKLGVPNLGTLIYYFPHSYENWINIKTISQSKINKDTCLKVTIIAGTKILKLGSKKTIYKALASDGENNIEITFFNNKYVTDKLKEGNILLIYGKIKLKLNKYEMICPKMHIYGQEPKGLKPIYGQIRGLPSWKIENIMSSGLNYLEKIKIHEYLPQKLIDNNNLCSWYFAIKNIHFPKDTQSLSIAKKRLSFEEIFNWQMGMKFIKKEMTKKTDVILNKEYTDEYYRNLPFTPTKAQKRAVSECIYDMSNIKKICMNRLLQGDVGSGKTVVAGALTYNIIKNDYQVAIMAPTEILAHQHYETFNKLLATTSSSIKIGLLTSSMKVKLQKKVKNEIREGNIHLLIGTHSIISEDVTFKNLGLVITDEQHRFGVHQRYKLVNKGKNPHVLVMSATPIPRSLSLIMYGDMNVSILDELPAGRQPVDTFVINSSKRNRMYNFIKKILDDKKQGYIVCPCVEESSIENLSNVINYREKLINEYGFSKYNIAALHGKMKSQEKDTIMNDFLNKKIDLLISTTVIEVGVDVPNACIMVIENAERFGLSQLHQLRGRVGRGNDKSYCILVSDSKSKDSIKRLKIMVSSSDGFYLANEDLKMRGPGEFLGDKQHGEIDFKLIDVINDISLIQKISDITDKIYKNWGTISTDDKILIEDSIKAFFSHSNKKGITI